MSTWPTHPHHHHEYTPISLKDQWTQQWSYHYPPPQVTYLLVKVSNTQTQNKSPPRLSQNPKLFQLSLSLSLSLSMEAMKPLMKLCIAKLKQGTLLWLEGFKEACCLHRVVILCLRSLLSLKFVFFFCPLNIQLLSMDLFPSIFEKQKFGGRSRKLLIRTGQCFLLNGFIFLGR